MRSAGTGATGRGSMPRARRRRSSPWRPGRERRAGRRRRGRRGRRSSRGRRRARRCVGARAHARAAPAAASGARKAASPPGGDHRHAARLVAVGGHLGDHLAGGDAQRAGQPHPLGHGAAHRVGGLGGALVGQLEVALVQAELLDRRRQLAHQVPDARRPLAVVGDVGAHEHHVGAAPQRLGGAHRRADAEAPGGVVGRRHHARGPGDRRPRPRRARAARGAGASPRRRRTRRGRGGRSRGHGPRRGYPAGRAASAREGSVAGMDGPPPIARRDARADRRGARARTRSRRSR